MSLVADYEQCLPIWLHADGFARPPLLARHRDNTLSMACMAIPQETIFHVVMTKFMADLTIKEIIFGVDRYTQPDQGTKYADVLTVFWWHNERVNENYGWQFGVVNYRPPPDPIIEPIDWNNPHWTSVMMQIVKDHYRHAVRDITNIAALGGQDVVDRLRQIVIEARDRRKSS